MRDHDTDHHEVERAFSLDALGPDDELPDLAGVPGVTRVGEPDEALLVATYVDTVDLALVRAGVTLRRRTGGSDAGWHLKIPAGDGRDEVHRPLGRSERVPPALAAMVLGWTRGRDLSPVAVIETRRTTRLLHGTDPDGAEVVLAETADDRVVGTPSGGGPVTSWRELEVELVGGGPALLDAATATLAEAGIEVRHEQRKIGSVLAHRLDAWPAPPEPAVDGPASAVLHVRLTRLVEELRRRDCDVRRGVDDGVHQLRVTCRRLRGALATFRPLVDREVTDPLRDELRWLAQTLGDGRDAEVMRERLRGLVAVLPAVEVVGPVRRRVERTYADRLRVADDHAHGVLTSRRHLQLLAGLERLVSAPPWTEVAQRPAGEVLPARVARDVDRLRSRMRAARRLVDDPRAHEEALHDVRKAAKRLRYACETLEPVWGEHAKALRKAAQAITRVLGERQDTAVTRVDLRRLATAATAAGESAFTYGVLHGREHARGEALEADLTVVWDAVRRKRLRRWLG